MRMIRGLAAMLALVALAPEVVAAQQGRPFKDAWFWGVKLGGMSYSTVLETNNQAPTIGADWVITRTRGGVYMSFDHAFFERESALLDRDPFTGDLMLREVELDGMTRVNVMGMGFPFQTQTVRPYFGLGLALSHIGSARLGGTFETEDQFLLLNEQLLEHKTSISPTAMIGAQWALKQVHVFAQAGMTSAQSNFFLNDGDGGFRYSYEIGVRYNIGRSIDR